MKNRLFLAAVTALAFVACSVLFAQDTRGPAKKGRKALPPSWSKLGLSEDQKKQIYTIQAEYGTKVDALLEQIRDLRKKQTAEMSKVLTDAQRTKLKEIIAAKAGDVGEDKIKGNKDKDKQ